MTYDAVTLDTNIFTNNQYDLEHGLLAQLSQFKEATARFVLSEIVHRELTRHLLSATATKRHRLISLAREARDSGLLPPQAAQQVATIIDTAVTPEDAVKLRLDRFIEATGMEIVPATTPLADLLDHYFSTSPPFEPSGAKKKEFPDAIALMSLDTWAQSHKLKILAISGDTGWAAYADTSKHLDVQADFATALSQFQTQHTQASAFVDLMLRAVNSGEAPVLQREVHDALKDVIPELRPHAVAESREEYTISPPTLELGEVELHGHGDATSFTIVRAGARSIAFTVLSTIHYTATAEVTFHGYEDDAGPYDYDKSDFHHDDWFEADLLFELDTSGLFPVLTSVELIDLLEEVDFGDIESDVAYWARRD